MKVAILAYYFWPDQSVGSVRPGNWAGWLGEFYDVAVVTPCLNSSECVELKYNNYKVVRVYSFFIKILELINFYRKKNRNKITASGCKTDVVWRGVVSGVFTYRMPCLHDFWIFPGYMGLRQLRPDLIIATHGPYANLIVAWIYKIMNPEVTIWADFRDLWTDSRGASGIPIFRSLEKYIERKILKSADIVTSVSENICNKINNKLNRDVELVYNSPMIDEAKSFSVLRSQSRLSICYTGTVYPGWQDPSALFAMLRDLLEERVVCDASFVIVLASRHPGNFVSIADRYGMKNVVDYRGAVSRQEALRIQREADVLLLLESPAPEAQGVLTGKVFEYLATDKPILLIGPGPDSELYQLLKKHDRLFTLKDLQRFLRKETPELPRGKPVDYSEISKGQLLDIMNAHFKKHGPLRSRATDV